MPPLSPYLPAYWQAGLAGVITLLPSPLAGEGQGGGEIPMKYEDNIFKKGEKTG